MGNKQSAPQLSEEQKNSRLSDYFEYLYSEYLSCRRSDEEYQDLKMSVQEMVYYIATELGNVDNRFRIQRILFAGSMFEKTSNGEPNEFDFILISESLSRSNEFEPIRECQNKPGFVHFVLKHDASVEFLNTWKDIIKGRKLRSTKTRFFTHGIRDRFRETLTTAVNNLKKSLKVQKSTGTLVIHDQEPKKHGPASMITLIWKPNGGQTSKQLYITVDMTFAIWFADVNTIIQESEVEHEEYYRELKDSKGFMAITGGESTCSAGFCHRLTFTNTELNIMVKLSDHHKKCYRILKYIFNGADSHVYITNLIFHSYAVKTYVLKHHLICKRHINEQGGLAMCIMEVLNEIERKLRECERESKWYERKCCVTVPCVLLRSHNIFQREMEKSLLEANIKGFELMESSIRKISELELIGTSEEILKLFRKHSIVIARSYVQQQPKFTFTFSIGLFKVSI